MKIELEEYNDAWPSSFIIEKELLDLVMGKTKPVIEHIGSTAVPGLSAKPVIDIMIGLQDFSMAGLLVDGMKKLGYKYIAEYEDELPNRKFFLKSSGGERSHHVHMVQLNNDFWERHIFFRNHLRDNEKSRIAYADLKSRLSKLDWEDRNQYAMAKSAFINAVEKRFF
ncbi:MAG: GrpB family protein [Flavobacteriales bacterium]|nr:GrpB family protein [Flavobacteriales bacterium]